MGTQGQTGRLGIGALLLLGVFAWAPATYPGYWQALEGFVPIFNATGSRSVANIATTPDLWRGAGADTFLLVRPLLLLGFTPTAAVRTTFILALLLGGLGIYAWLRFRLGDRAAGLAGLIYMLLPSVLATIYLRGCLSDALILGLLPMALAGIAIHANTRSLIAAAVVIITLVWMWCAQAGLAVFATGLLVLYTLYVERQGLTLVVVLLSAAAGFSRLLPSWSIQAPAPVSFSEHFVYFFQLFGTQWQVAPSIPGWQDGYPFQLGFTAIVFGIVAGWLWWRAEKSQFDPWFRRLLRFSAIGALLLISLSLTLSAPLWALSRADRLLTYPWQVLLVAGPLLALLAGSLPALHHDFSQPAYWSVLTTLALLSSYGYLQSDFTQVQPPAEPVAIFGTNHEIVVLAADFRQRDNPPTAQLEITWQVLRPLAFEPNIFFQAQTGDEAAPQVIAQLDAPPLGGQPPATQWQPGEIFVDRYELDLQQVPDRQNLRYAFGYYNWQNGQRLPLDGGPENQKLFYGQ